MARPYAEPYHSGRARARACAAVWNNITQEAFSTVSCGGWQVFESKVQRITPLCLNPGRVVITDARIYFQPFNAAEARLQ